MRVEGKKQDVGFRLSTASNGFALGWESRARTSALG